MLAEVPELLATLAALFRQSDPVVVAAGEGSAGTEDDGAVRL